MKLRDAAAVLVGLKFADTIHYKSKSSHTSVLIDHQSEHHIANGQW